MKFREGQYVTFGGGDLKFKGRIVRQIDDRYYLVEDRTGRPPRPVTADRIQSQPYSTALSETDAA